METADVAGSESRYRIGTVLLARSAQLNPERHDQYLIELLTVPLILGAMILKLQKCHIWLVYSPSANATSS